MLPPHFSFSLEPAPPADFAIGDSGATTSSIPLKWSSTGANYYAILLDGEVFGLAFSDPTYNITHRELLTAGTPYLCSMLATMNRNDECTTDSSELQTIICSTAQPADAPTCTSKLYFLTDVPLKSTYSKSAGIVSQYKLNK